MSPVLALRHGRHLDRLPDGTWPSPRRRAVDLSDGDRNEISDPALARRTGRVRRPNGARQHRRCYAARSHAHVRPRVALRGASKIVLALEPERSYLVGLPLIAYQFHRTSCISP